MELWSKIHSLSIIWMTAVIWCVQLIIYPSFRRLDRHEFSRFHELHSRNITFIVAAPMLMQWGTAHVLFWSNPFQLLNLQYMICINLIFGSTFFLSIPYHHSLQKGYSEKAAIKLERFNWIRTLLWSYECVLIVMRH